MSNSKPVINRSRVIIEAIDALRTRKARPDESRICHWIERRYGIKKEDIIKSIEDSVVDGSVLRVKYKDSISYRNPAKFTRFVHSSVSKYSAPQNVTKRILRVIRQLTRTDASQKDGASVLAILRSLHQSKQLLNYNEAHLERILNRLAQNSTLSKLPNGNYILHGSKRIIARRPNLPVKTVGSNQPGHKHPTQSAASSSVSAAAVSAAAASAFADKRGSNAETLIKRRDSDTSLPNSDLSLKKKKAIPVPPLVAAIKRARPISKRKKFKKSLGPDFLEPSDMGLQYLQDSFEPKCDFCQYTASSNPIGVPEELLVCKDCDAKAHPSCMHYTDELAARSRRSPWQCIDCKTCVNCNDSGDWDFMLFCDLCDKGYHMTCHVPALNKKPTGKWVCTGCLTQERKRSNGKRIATDDPNEGGDDKASTSTCATDLGETSSISEEFLVKQKVPIISERTVFRHLLPHPREMLEAYPDMPPNPQEWSVDHVVAFLKFIGFPDQATIFKEQEIDGISLLLLRRMDVLTGLSMKLGPALKIFGHVQHLQIIHAQD